MQASSDVVLVNLRVLSKLKQGDRLQCADSRYFGIDRSNSWLWVAISRWMNRDNRQNMLERVESVFEQAKSISFDNKDQHIEAAKTGLRELIHTYADDPTTISRLENLIEDPPEQRIAIEEKKNTIEL